MTPVADVVADGARIPVSYIETIASVPSQYRNVTGSTIHLNATATGRIISNDGKAEAVTLCGADGKWITVPVS